jgi:hypothetical protein
MAINDFLAEASEAIQKSNSFFDSLAHELAPIKTKKTNTGENIVLKSEKRSVSGKFAGVDSGFVPKKLASIDLLLIRRAGVVFTYNNGRLEKAEYYPKAFSLPEPVLLRDCLESDEEQQSVSLERLKRELQTSIEIIEKFKPDYLFIDGSIVPQYQDKPRGESKVNEDYQSIVHFFQKLYSVAEKNNCFLISCVEDSRGARFTQLLQEEFLKGTKFAEKLENIFDSSFLDYFLNEGERTFAFPYTSNIKSHAILKDYKEEWAKNIFVLYLKASKFDKPLRVEFICKNDLKECAEKVSSIVYSLSNLHKEYTYPSVLIEADLRARLTPQEINTIYEKLIDRVGKKVMLRRNSRPFG